VVAHLEAAHASAQRLHHTRAFVTQHDGLWRMAAGMFVQIGMADAGGDQAHQHFSGAREFEFQ